jgi:hypothetical protein
MATRYTYRIEFSSHAQREALSLDISLVVEVRAVKAALPDLFEDAGEERTLASPSRRPGRAEEVHHEDTLPARRRRHVGFRRHSCRHGQPGATRTPDPYSPSAPRWHCGAAFPQTVSERTGMLLLESAHTRLRC